MLLISSRPQCVNVVEQNAVTCNGLDNGTLRIGRLEAMMTQYTDAHVYPYSGQIS